jgi:hypothetical protein
VGIFETMRLGPIWSATRRTTWRACRRKIAVAYGWKDDKTLSPATSKARTRKSCRLDGENVTLMGEVIQRHLSP